MRNEEIIKAVEIIKEICMENQHCGDCPYGTDVNGCNITSDDRTPEDWEITEPKPFRAFR